eukprot:TRINITY_DN49309_c0_g1_i1.p1 TRINITY_DN49309_c0_g1~~TRINITY_DN49309_c0_g1_i1.p1  ORF type:complete len:429 (-),score=66.57 TRINITY_DN49309_c0_g1_i1:169-1455(-)
MANLTKEQIGQMVKYLLDHGVEVKPEVQNKEWWETDEVGRTGLHIYMIISLVLSVVFQMMHTFRKWFMQDTQAAGLSATRHDNFSRVANGLAMVGFSQAAAMFMFLYGQIYGVQTILSTVCVLYSFGWVAKFLEDTEGVSQICDSFPRNAQVIIDTEEFPKGHTALVKPASIYDDPFVRPTRVCITFAVQTVLMLFIVLSLREETLKVKDFEAGWPGGLKALMKGFSRRQMTWQRFLYFWLTSGLQFIGVVSTEGNNINSWADSHMAHVKLCVGSLYLRSKDGVTTGINQTSPTYRYFVYALAFIVNEVFLRLTMIILPLLLFESKTMLDFAKDAVAYFFIVQLDDTDEEWIVIGSSAVAHMVSDEIEQVGDGTTGAAPIHNRSLQAAVGKLLETKETKKDDWEKLFEGEAGADGETLTDSLSDGSEE